MDWRPIKSGPIDGTVFLAWDDYSKQVIRALWCKTPHVPIYGWHWYDDPEPENRDIIEITHWMPLPAPPLTLEQERRRHLLSEIAATDAALIDVPGREG